MLQNRADAEMNGTQHRLAWKCAPWRISSGQQNLLTWMPKGNHGRNHGEKDSHF